MCCCIVLIITACFLLSACKKENSVQLDFSKITVTDLACIYISNVDTSDWTLDNTWTNQETNLMNFSRTVSTTDTVAGYVQVSAACPNPSAGSLAVGVNTERACVMKAVFVNNDMQILHYSNQLLTGGPIITYHNFTSLSSFKKDANYRMYYAFYTAKDSLYYKGHGDFRIE